MVITVYSISFDTKIYLEWAASRILLTFPFEIKEMQSTLRRVPERDQFFSHCFSCIPQAISIENIFVTVKDRWFQYSNCSIYDVIKFPNIKGYYKGASFSVIALFNDIALTRSQANLYIFWRAKQVGIQTYLRNDFILFFTLYQKAVFLASSTGHRPHLFNLHQVQRQLLSMR